MASADAGRSAVVTGATSGIGHAIARALVARGWTIFAGMRRPGDDEALRASLGEGVYPLLLDVTDPAARADAAARVSTALGGRTLDALVNNAGIGTMAPLASQPPEDVERQVAVNLTAQILTTQAFLPLLGLDGSRGGPKGRIVMMSSLGGVLGQPFAAAYCASKHGLEGFAASLRRELAGVGIGVIIMAPSAVDTPVWDKLEASDPLDNAHGRFAAPFRRALDAILHVARHDALSTQDVARATVKALEAKTPPVRVALARHPILERAIRGMPARTLDRIMANRLGLNDS